MAGRYNPAERRIVKLRPPHPGRKPIVTNTRANLESMAALGRLQAGVREIAAFFGIHPATVSKSFKRYPDLRQAWENGKGEGLITLRRNQFELSKKNPALAIFLGKNYLGQADERTTNYRVSGRIEHQLSRMSDAELLQIAAGNGEEATGEILDADYEEVDALSGADETDHGARHDEDD